MPQAPCNIGTGLHLEKSLPSPCDTRHIPQPGESPLSASGQVRELHCFVSKLMSADEDDTNPCCTFFAN
jgi:hypothetical protein